LTRTLIEIAQWTAPQLERLVLDSNPKVAVFDCDGTLWGGDAGSGFMNWTLQQSLVSRSTTDWIDTRYRAYQAGQVSELEICGAMVQMYAGLRDQELHAQPLSMWRSLFALAFFLRWLHWWLRCARQVWRFGP